MCFHFSFALCKWLQHVLAAPAKQEQWLSFPLCCLTLSKPITAGASLCLISNTEVKEVAEVVIVLPGLAALQKRQIH